MFICLIIVTRNSSIAVRTLHNILNFNAIAIQHKFQVDCNFVNDNQFEKTKLLMKKLKSSCDRIFFIEYGVSLDIESVKKVFEPFEKSYHGVVFPCVTPGVDWDMFKKKVRSECEEPLLQMGLNFDTEVSTKINDDCYKISKTEPRVWVIDTKSILKNLREKKGESIKLPADSNEMFEKFLQKGVKLYAFVKANPCITYQHECFSNILQSAGVVKD